MERPRDSQRSAAFNARSVLRSHSSGRFTMFDCHAYLTKLIDSAWFKRRWPRVRSDRLNLTTTTGAGRANVSFANMEITLGEGDRTDWMCLWMISYFCARAQYGDDIAWHGWEFCAVFLELVEHQMGRDAAAALTAEWRDRKVRYRAPRPRRELSPEQKQAAVARLAAARSAKQNEPHLVWRHHIKAAKGVWRKKPVRLVIARHGPADPPEGTIVHDSHSGSGMHSGLMVTDARADAREKIDTLAPTTPGVMYEATITRTPHTETWRGVWVVGGQS